jgi:uncharacterized membrane protein YagU involved in acid resistance
MLSKLVSAWARLEAWLNAPFYHKARRIDLILAIGFVLCVSYYWYVSGWRGAIIGSLMYILMMMVCLWLI